MSERTIELLPGERTGEATGLGCGPGGGCLVTTPTYRPTANGRLLRRERTARRLFLGCFRTSFGLAPEQVSGLEIGRYDASPADWGRLFAWLATRFACPACGGLGRGAVVPTGQTDEHGDEEAEALPCPGVGCADGSIETDQRDLHAVAFTVTRDGVTTVVGLRKPSVYAPLDPLIFKPGNR